MVDSVHHGDAMEAGAEERPGPLSEWDNEACGGLKRGFGVRVGKFLVILNVCLWLLEKWYWIWWNHRAVRNCSDNLVQLLEFIGEEINRRGYLGSLACSRITLRPSWTDTKIFSFEPFSLYETTLFSSDGYFFNRTPLIFLNKAGITRYLTLEN